MKILVLGSNGQTGLSMQDLASKGAFPAEWEFIFWTREDLELSSLESIYPKLRDVDFDVCVNLAAYTDVAKAESGGDKGLNKTINSELPQHLSQVCAMKNVKLIHISTDYVFGGYKEDLTPFTTPSPQNKYGAEKLLGEGYVAEFSNHCVIRTSSVYSEHGNNFVLNMIGRFSQNLPTQVSGGQFMCPTYAGNLCLAIIRAIQLDLKGVWHYNDGDYMSWWALASIVEGEMNTDCLSFVKDFPSSVKRPAYSHMQVGVELKDVKYHKFFLTTEDAVSKIVSIRTK